MGADYYRYHALIEQIENINFHIDDIGFQSIIVFLKLFNLNTNLIIFIIATMSFLLVRIGLKNSYYPCFSVLIYYSLYMIPFNFNAMAQGIAVGFFLYSIRFIKEKNTTMVLIITICASLVHITGIFILFSYVLYRLKLDKVKIICILLGCVFLLFANKYIGMLLIKLILPSAFSMRFQSYVMQYDVGLGIFSILPRFILITIVVIFGYHKMDSINKNLTKIYIMSFVLYSIFSMNALFATRINLFLKVLDVILIPNTLYFSKNNEYRLIIFLVVALMMLMILVSNFSYIELYPYKHIFM